MDKGTQILIGHLGRDKGVVEHAAVDTHGGVEWVQTGGDLHGLYLIYRFAGGIEGAAQIEWGTTIGVVVFDNEILHLLCIHEGRCEGVLLGLDIVVVVEAILSKHLLNLLMRARGDLVNHRPREGDLGLVFQIREESSGNKSVGYPLLSICEDTSLYLVAIVRAVVHRLYGKWQLSGIEALKQQRTNLTHSKHGLQSASQIGIVVAIAFLCDCEGNHL